MNGPRHLPEIQSPTTVTLRVEPSDVDGYEIVHFARYAVFAEQAGLNFLDKHGFGLDSLTDIGLELRVRELRINYRASARCGDVLELQAGVARLGRAHLSVAVQIKRALPAGGSELLTHIVLDYVFVDMLNGKTALVPAGLATSLGGAH